MKKLFGFVLIAVVGYWLYRRYLENKRDPLREHLREQEQLRRLGYEKADVTMREQIPIMSVGETPLSGIAQTIFNLFGGQTAAKDTQLQPKGLYHNPYDSIITRDSFAV